MDTTTTVDTTAPAVSSETTPAAPATVETSASPTTSARPTNVRELTAWMAKQDTTDTPETAATTETGATGPAATPAAPAPPKEPPAEKWPTILENARTKAATEGVSTYRREYGIPEGMPKDYIPKAIGLAQRIATDPVGTLRALHDELIAHPTYGPQLRSQAGRTLATRGQGDLMPPPDVEIVNEHGQITGRTYSADQLQKRDAWNERRLLASVQRELQPINAEREQRHADARQAEMRRDVEAVADKQIAHADLLLDGAFTSKNTAVLQVLNDVMTAHPDWSIYDAAAEVRKTHIMPGLDRKATAKALDTFKTKAAGNTANGAGTTATPVRPRDAKSLAKWMEQHA